MVERRKFDDKLIDFNEVHDCTACGGNIEVSCQLSQRHAGKNLVDMYRTSNRRAETYADSVAALLARTTLLLLGQRRDRQRFTGQTDTRTTLYAFRRELGCSVITNDSS